MESVNKMLARLFKFLPGTLFRSAALDERPDTAASPRAIASAIGGAISRFTVEKPALDAS
jgi:hypothetical protein